jgi:hypothetical protein
MRRRVGPERRHGLEDAMTRLLALLVCLLAFSVLSRGWLLTSRIEPEDTRVIASTSEPTATTAWPAEPQPTLPSGFDPERVREWTHPKPATKAKRGGELSWHGHACGGDLPPCYVMRRESGGDIHAYNPHGCGGRGCYGKWQCDPRTCTGRGTEAQQDDEARALWNHGRGCQHWSACR